VRAVFRINFSFDLTELDTEGSSVHLAWGRMELNPGLVNAMSRCGFEPAHPGCYNETHTDAYGYRFL
jgi:hypothetical protein